MLCGTPSAPTRWRWLKNAGQVALEIGNSATIVMKHYFDIVGHE
jgi:hypothetical protein